MCVFMWVLNLFFYKFFKYMCFIRIYLVFFFDDFVYNFQVKVFKWNNFFFLFVEGGFFYNDEMWRIIGIFLGKKKNDEINKIEN